MSVSKFIRKQKFEPGFFGIFVNPFYLARKALHEAVSSLAARIEGKTLDVGCGQKPYMHLFRTAEYVGLEVDTPESRATKKADVYFDGGVFPFQDGEFDSIVCNQVLEHVFLPDLCLAEMNRVLKGGGILLLTVPFVWDEHEQPWDYARYSSFGLKSLLEKHGFEIIVQKKTLADMRAIFQLINAYLFKVCRTDNRYINFAATVLLMSPFTLLGIVLGWSMPSNEDFYLDNVVLARKEGAI